VAVYLPLIQWLGLSIGLKMPRQLTAIIVTLVIVCVWVGGLASVPVLLDYFHLEWNQVKSAALWLSPADMIGTIHAMVPRLGVANEFNSRSKWPWIAPLAHFAFYAVLWGLLRWHCLRSADRFLGRITQPAAAQAMLEV
jgi:hypothetical protein